MQSLTPNSEELQDIFREIGLYSPKEQFYAAKIRKHKQVLDYIIQVEAALKKLSSKRPIVMIDCGCGKSYLSFILYEYCRVHLNRKVQIIGVDNNPELIAKCQLTAKNLHFENMHFVAATAGDFKAETPVDIVYSLHACNTATDQTIAQGIKSNAKYIFSVSCCQHRNRALMEKHSLTSITRFQPYKERLTDMVGDSMRALLLEHLGYGVKLFEFTAAEQTPKNIMLRASKGTVKRSDQENAAARYKQLVEFFNFSPLLEKLTVVLD